MEDFNIRMAKLLVDGICFEELSIVASYYEAEFSSTIRDHANEAFPDFFTIPYTLVMSFDDETAKPDLAMIRKDYKEWWIVEVELAKHTLSHVLGQIDIFNNGTCSITPDKIAETMYEKNSSLDLAKLKKMVKKVPSKTMVIVDGPKDDWLKELKNRNTELCIFQVFRNTNGHNVYRVNGYSPIFPVMETHCKIENGLPNYLLIHDPTILTISHNEIMSIDYNGKVSDWIRFDSKPPDKRVYLVAKGSNPASPNHAYVLRKNSRNQFYLKVN